MIRGGVLFQSLCFNLKILLIDGMSIEKHLGKPRQFSDGWVGFQARVGSLASVC